MTTQQTSSVRSAIAQCNAYISREAGRNPDLRPNDIQERLDWYYAHRARLLAMVGK